VPAVVQMLLAGGPLFVRRTAAAVTPATTSAPARATLIVGIVAGVVLVLVMLAAWRFLRDRRRRAETMRLIRGLLDDAEAATRDAVLVHQARRRVLPTRPRRS
jgi:Tfp pilus assembly protein PilX